MGCALSRGIKGDFIYMYALLPSGTIECVFTLEDLVHFRVQCSMVVCLSRDY